MPTAAAQQPTLAHTLTAEFAGPGLLVVAGVGSAVLGLDSVGAVGVALSFGLVPLAPAYALGAVSGRLVSSAADRAAGRRDRA